MQNEREIHEQSTRYKAGAVSVENCERSDVARRKEERESTTGSEMRSGRKIGEELRQNAIVFFQGFHEHPLYGSITPGLEEFRILSRRTNNRWT